ncbi:R8 protein [Elasticomyces elasticus]|nr:R8 protein [Elasticomyces elasticus]KAK4974398.1 R8 protein [Elasticomyces elasticus]
MVASEHRPPCSTPTKVRSPSHPKRVITLTTASFTAVLTSRKHGVATVWLVATLGSKSSLKKVSRKAILDVDVAKACETIVRPEAPMALRLQSNLLYGVTRVYSQQCGYVLNDAEAAKNSMRDLLRVVRGRGLEVEGATKGRADQLLLQDDPNFLPDFDLVPIDLNQLELHFNPGVHDESQGSVLSPYDSQQMVGSNGGSQHTPMLNDFGRSSSLVGGPVGGRGGSEFGIRGDSGRGGRVGGQSEWLVEDGLDLDDLGLVVEDDGTGGDGGRQGSVHAGREMRMDVGGSGSRADGARLGGDAGGQDDGLAQQDDGFMPMLDDDQQPQQPTHHSATPHDNAGAQVLLESHTTTSTASAPMAATRRRNKAAPKVLVADTAMELRNGDLARWNTNYVSNMQETARHKFVSRAAAIAKENAKLWVMGGIGGWGQADTILHGPLGMFSGAKLLEALTGMDLTGTGEKRGRDAITAAAADDGNEEDQRARKRSRVEGELSSDEVGRGVDHQYAADDGYMPQDAEDYSMGLEIEQGREAPTPLDDRHLSSVFPWNQLSTGRGEGVSRRPTGLFTSATLPGAVGGVGGSGMGLARRGSRLLSASPLVGRGVAVAGQDGGGDVGFGQDGYGTQQGRSGAIMGHDVEMSGLTDEDFELFGPAAEVDTQTAAQSQWVRTALDTESENFLGFVRAAIAEADAAREQAGDGDEEDDDAMGTVLFEKLLEPAGNTCVVAAQGLLHVLALGTKGLLEVGQGEAFGGIRLRAVGV